MPTVEACYTAIRKAFADSKISDEDIKEILEDLDKMARRHGEYATVSVVDSLAKRAEELADNVARAAMIARRNTLLDGLALSRMLATAEAMHQKYGDAGWALNALLGGSNKVVQGSRRSADNIREGLFRSLMGPFIQKVKESGEISRFNSRDRGFQVQIAKELYNLSEAHPVENPTGNLHARKIALMIREADRLSMVVENNAGGYRQMGRGYVLPFTPNLFRLAKHNRQDWVAKILPLLDIDRTFRGLEVNPEQALGKIYDAMIAGRGYVATGADENSLHFSVRSSDRLRKARSNHAELIFKDAESWVAANEVYGHTPISEVLLLQMERSARNAALMQTFGPSFSPDTLREWRDVLLEMYPENQNTIISGVIDNQFEQATGRLSIPTLAAMDGITSTGLATTTAVVNAWQNVSKLGSAILPSIADLATRASSLHRRGISTALGGWLDSFNQTFASLAPGDQRSFLELAGFGIDRMADRVVHRFASQEYVPGWVTDVNRHFFMLNLLTPWTDLQKFGTSAIGMKWLGQHADRSWLDLPEKLRASLEVVGFNARSWEHATRQGVVEAAGHKLLSADAILKKGENRENIDAATLVQSWLADLVEEATPTPGVRERSALLFGSRAGTPLGAVVRMFAAFKGFPLTIITKQLSRSVEADSTREFFKHLAQGKGSRAAVAQMILGVTVMGYAGMTVNDVLHGRNPKDLREPSTWVDALKRGGALGLYADFILGEYHKYGRDIITSAVGPGLSSLGDTVNTLYKMAYDPSKLESESLKWAMRHAPGANLFYFRTALDHLLLYNLQESVNPGSLRRAEKALREEGTTFYYPPSAAAR